MMIVEMKIKEVGSFESYEDTQKQNIGHIAQFRLMTLNKLTMNAIRLNYNFVDLFKTVYFKDLSILTWDQKAKCCLVYGRNKTNF